MFDQIIATAIGTTLGILLIIVMLEIKDQIVIKIKDRKRSAKKK